ncbi:MAG: hypothetical protein MUO63_16745 [Desulfobulbaceae bacterium]|nr:hypothetical protein [Desulfobulbaceae bacterium]
MKETGEQRPGVIVRTVCATAGLAAALVRLSAGIVAVACLGYFVKERVKKSKKMKKNYFSPPSQGKEHSQ